MTCQTPSRRCRIQTWFNGYRQSCSVLSLTRFVPQGNFILLSCGR